MLEDYAFTWKRWRDVRDRLEKITMDEAERLREIDLLAFQVREIEEVDPHEGEMEALLKERKRMQNREELFINVREAYASIVGGEGEGGVLDAIGYAEAAISRAAGLDEDLQQWCLQLRETQEAIAAIGTLLRVYAEGLDFQPGQLEAVEARLRVLGDLTRKYGSATAEILEHLERARLRLEELSNLEKSQDDARQEAARLEAELAGAADTLSASRKTLAEKLTRETNKELKDMNMAGMRFRVELERTAEYAKSGRDVVEFTISPGKGLPFRPLGRIASGGELSRIMLALKIALARADAVPTLVFDEVDSGIGGVTADILAVKLSRIGDFHQVFSVTHLPQIAALSNRHMSVRKNPEAKGVSTAVELLEAEGRVDELVRMLGGDQATARKHALSMLRKKG
jgi:DNA repair protein RecN (Recombination protein N)